MKTHKELMVWQKSIELVLEIYQLVKLLPREETFGLSDQMRRAVVSIPSNIAEGNGRESDRELLRFLLIAQGSNAEIETQLIICEKLGYISAERLEKARGLSEEVSKMLRVFIQKIRKGVISQQHGTKADS